MKMKPEHIKYMQDAIAPLDTEERREAYRTGNFPRADKVKDLEKRYRWDLFWAANLTRWCCDTLYSYISDTHIDTALRSIVKPLKVIQ